MHFVLQKMMKETLDIAFGLHERMEHMRQEMKVQTLGDTNILCALNLREPDISKVIAVLLQQDIMVVKSFVRVVFKEAFQETIIKPQIETEYSVQSLNRIDIAIFEPKRYAIIIENKVWDAPEQTNQLANYIDGMRGKGYSDEQIYIVYLTKDGTLEPTDISWNNEMKQRFEKRYQCISFTDDIFRWLEETDMKNVRGELYNCSRMLFLDYLRHTIKPNQKKMEQEKIDNLIKEYFNLKGEPIADSDILSDNIYKISEVLFQLKASRKHMMEESMNKWLEQLNIDYPEFEKLDKRDDRQWPAVGVALPFGDIPLTIEVKLSYMVSSGNLFVATECAEGNKGHTDDMIEFVREAFLPMRNYYRGKDWIYYCDTSYHDGYNKLKQIIEALR